MLDTFTNPNLHVTIVEDIKAHRQEVVTLFWHLSQEAWTREIRRANNLRQPMDFLQVCVIYLETVFILDHILNFISSMQMSPSCHLLGHRAFALLCFSLISLDETLFTSRHTLFHYSLARWVDLRNFRASYTMSISTFAGTVLWGINLFIPHSMTSE